MTKTEIVKALEKETNGQAFITASQLTKLLGRTDSGKVKNSILTNLEAMNGKYYLIKEVADTLKSMCV